MLNEDLTMEQVFKATLSVPNRSQVIITYPPVTYSVLVRVFLQEIIVCLVAEPCGQACECCGNQKKSEPIRRAMAVRRTLWQRWGFPWTKQ